jgi:regulator of protease activity HflC (stomatin/prohibitin superfamily)
MKYMKNIMVVLIVAMFATGCSRVTVPPAAKGKVLSASGYSVDVKEPGKYWLPWWNNMVILDTSTTVAKEVVDVKMSDKLDTTFEVRFRTRIMGNDKIINAMFNDITHEKYQVSVDKVYSIYGRDVVRSTIRSVASKYTAEEIPNNFDKVTQELRTELTKALENSPLEMSNVTIGAIIYPDTITAAINAQAERRLAIETEQNQQAIEMVKRTNELELAEAEYEIRMTRARAIRDENVTTAEGLKPELLQYRQLEVLEKLAENKNAVFVPYEALTNVGLQNRMFSK